jgi:STE24 endopeptidase
MGEVIIDQARQARAKQYARIQRRMTLVGIAVAAGYTLAWLLFGWSRSLGAAASVWTGANPWLQVGVYALIFGGIYELATLVPSYYESYYLPHRFEMSNQTLGGWLWDEVKGLLVGSLLGLIVLEVIYVVLRLSPDWWWLWAGLILLLFSVVLANLAPVLLMPIFYKFVPLGEEYLELAERLKRLAEQANTHVQGVYAFDMSSKTKAANAALAGLGNTRRIILGDTLLKEFTSDEIETILAHELGHQVNRDIPLGIIVQSVITLGGLYLAALGLKWGAAVFGFGGPADIAALPVLMVVLGLYGLLTLPLTNAFSRWRERRADEYALRVTRNGPAFASALARLANQNLADADPEPWVEWLLHSHPALSKRIAMAEAFRGLAG